MRGGIVRKPFTTAQAYAAGINESTLRWRVKTGNSHRVSRGVYIDGEEPPTPMERALAKVWVVDGVATGSLAAILQDFDGVRLHVPYVAVLAISQSHRKGLR